mmetsp:Transcript_18368/g.13368  ORF Transcript_18368/g.13368 Transcript_18368/m.13368 type:complete len:80 (-) Transcript_18368:479-718(-)
MKRIQDRIYKKIEETEEEAKNKMREINKVQTKHNYVTTDLEQKKLMFLEMQEQAETQRELYKNKLEDMKDKVEKQEREN